MTAQLSEFDKVHMADILAGHGDWFSAQLMRLIMKADAENRARLMLAFPDHVETFIDYQLGRGRYATSNRDNP